MTQEEKQLLIQDLCARLPYEVKVNLHNEIHALLGYHDDYVMLTANVPTGQQTNIANIKPYLRPMSSMSFDERSYCLKRGSLGYNEYDKIFDVYTHGLKYTMEVLDFLNAHHFDYRGLIEKGLALEAPEDMYKTE